jgi:hypothetical protein
MSAFIHRQRVLAVKMLVLVGACASAGLVTSLLRLDVVSGLLVGIVLGSLSQFIISALVD